MTTRESDDDDLALAYSLLKVCTQRDLTRIATLVYDHSRAGRALGFRMFGAGRAVGDPAAEFRYAQALSTGVDDVDESRRRPRDLSGALAMLETIAEQRRYAPAMYVLALRLIRLAVAPRLRNADAPIDLPEVASATGIAADDSAAVDTKMLARGLRLLYKCATEQDYPLALIQMGHFYLHGEMGVAKDTFKAYELLEKAASKGVPEAMFLCGTCWEKGEGVEKADSGKAIEWWMKAANKGLAVAQHNIASVYFSPAPTSNIAKSVPLALEYYEMAAHQEFPLSLVNLAKLYKEGYIPQSGEPRSWAIRPDYETAEAFVNRIVSLGGNWEDIGMQLKADLEKSKLEGNGKVSKHSWFTW
ncbi:hypothetical protein HDU83_003978 [Entophlyctis luteolus]|nr:hypothetical protein HDU83_003978 [Entophlyctis luteolus]